jgi:hypothetical protein
MQFYDRENQAYYDALPEKPRYRVTWWTRPAGVPDEEWRDHWIDLADENIKDYKTLRGAERFAEKMSTYTTIDRIYAREYMYAGGVQYFHWESDEQLRAY